MKTSFDTVHKMIKDAFNHIRNGKDVVFGDDFETFHELRMAILKECGWTYPEYMEACNFNH